MRKGGQAQAQAQAYNNQGISTALAGATQLYQQYRRYGLNKTPRTEDQFGSAGVEIRGYR